MAQHPSSDHSGAPLTIQRVQAYPARGIALGSSALDAEGRIHDRYSAYHDDLVPDLEWSAVIEANSYVLVVEDPDAPMDRPFVHWLLWNIPGTATAIPAGLSRVPRPPELPGAIQGRNSGGASGWHGTKPPPGHGVHRYHFQLFALSETLDHLGPGTNLEELVNLLKGLTIAAGDLVGTYERLDSTADLTHADRRGDGRGGLDADDMDRHAAHEPSGEVRR